MDNTFVPVISQRFQVKISGQWNDYSPKEDDVLKLAFDQFVRKHNDKSSMPEPESRESGAGSSRYKEFVIKGRRYLVDFLEMKQVRKDNKKEYRVRPPLGSPGGYERQEGPREQGNLKLKCTRCHKPYTLRRMPPGSDHGDWADCFYCQDCWRPFLDKEEKKSEKNPKQRTAIMQPSRVPVPSAEQPCRVSALGMEKPAPRLLDQTLGALCRMPFQDDEPIFLGAVNEHEFVSCQPCHKHCSEAAKETIDEAIESIEKVKAIVEYFRSKSSLQSVRLESGMRRYIQEESKI